MKPARRNPDPPRSRESKVRPAGKRRGGRRRTREKTKQREEERTVKGERYEATRRRDIKKGQKTIGPLLFETQQPAETGSRKVATAGSPAGGVNLRTLKYHTEGNPLVLCCTK